MNNNFEAKHKICFILYLVGRQKYGTRKFLDDFDEKSIQ